MALPNAHNPYLKTQVETASKEQLVVMLFDGIIRFSEQARKAINQNDFENVQHFLMRAQAIVMELIYTVDREKGGEVAKNLLGLHAYAFNCLIVANMKKDTSKIDEVQKIYRELREGWVGAMESLGLTTKASSVPQAAQTQAAAPTQPAPTATAAKPGAAAAKPPLATYGAGKTAMPKITLPPAGVKPQAPKAAISGSQQQQRTQQMLSAYNNGSRSIA